jgi:hypothetical protein
MSSRYGSKIIAQERESASCVPTRCMKARQWFLELARIFLNDALHFLETTPSRPSIPRLSGPCKPVLLGVL